MGEDIRERTDALDAAGNTTAAIGKVGVWDSLLLSAHKPTVLIAYLG